MSELEDSVDEGPTIDAIRTGEPVVNVPPAERHLRWPTIAPVLHVAGVSSVHAVPLRHGDAVVGAITVFQRCETTLSARTLEGVTTLASASALGVARLLTLNRIRRRVAQLEQALSTRVAIEQAKGILAARLAISVDDAFDVMRQHARRHGRRLRAVAEAVVAGSLSAQELPRPA